MPACLYKAESSDGTHSSSDGRGNAAGRGVPVAVPPGPVPGAGAAASPGPAPHRPRMLPLQAAERAAAVAAMGLARPITNPNAGGTGKSAGSETKVSTLLDNLHSIDTVASDDDGLDVTPKCRNV